MQRSIVLAVLAVPAALGACSRAPHRTRPAPAAAPPPIEEAALDRSTDPCDDFYQFACGGWIAHTEIPPDRSAWQRSFSEIRERNAGALKEILDAAAAGRMASEPFADKLGDFWAACLDEAMVEAHGLDDLRMEWARIDAVRDRTELADVLARLQGEEIADPFRMFADQDPRDATQVVLTIAQGGLTLPDRDYYLSDQGKNPEIRQELGGHMRRMLGLAGVPAADAEAQAASVERMERAIAASHFTRTELRDPVKTANRVDRAGLERLAPGIPWARFFEGLGHADITAVKVTTPPFIEEAGKLFATAPLDEWKAYLRWHLLEGMAQVRALPRAFVEERFRFDARAFTGATQLLPRWKHCVEATDDALGFALGRIYVRLHFGSEGKERTTRLVGEIEKAMSRDLGALQWMDDATRGRAEEKLAAVANKVGYPGAWRDYSPMKVERASFFRSVLAAGRYEVNRQLSKVGRPLDRGEWFMSPPTVNAYYAPPRNEIVFPAGILQPPFWNRAAPETVNYGAIGMVVGHELTHGFDDHGRKFDARGDLADWWTADVSREFDRRASCVADQFSGYESIPGVRLNGRLTLGENIADLGGLKLAHAAMQASQAGAKAGDVAGFGPEQQFFVGYAQSWCSKYRDEDLRRRAVVDPHAPAKWRVNGPLSNLPSFAAAFRCSEGRPMVRPPDRRCEVW
ncbi:MAG TPA: M13 family metallopeptidase [Anaeromyxobacter sp.]|nr:M13 family metallopeptidase [Anaeromyxobacter sp.]